jgi:hypothetical protein
MVSFLLGMFFGVFFGVFFFALLQGSKIRGGFKGKQEALCLPTMASRGCQENLLFKAGRVQPQPKSSSIF